MGGFDFSKEAEATTEELMSETNRIVALSEEEIAGMIPERTDQEKLKRFIDALNQATTENDKKAAIIDNLGTLSQVAKDVVAKYAPRLIGLIK